MTSFSFSQVDVFAFQAPLDGNPVAVVHGATGIADEQMAAFARWTNLSETTFLLPPTKAAAEATNYAPADLHPGRGVAIRRASRRSGAPMRGSRPGVCRRQTDASSRSAVSA